MTTVVVFIVSCTKNNEIDDNISDFAWWSSPRQEFNSTSKKVKINNYLAFQDLSRGELSHKWIIEEGSKFLMDNFTTNDTIYQAFILEDAGLETTNDLAYVLFTELGTTTVTLINTFKEEVNESVFDEENNIWKVEKVITVEVEE